MRERDLPVGTVTFLFTDIEGSTRLLKRVGTQYGGILARHHELVRQAVLRHGGRELDTQGEAFFVAFSRAKDAAAAAPDAQRAHETEASAGRRGVLVRIGIHAAEPELTETGYFGLGVHRAARICAVCHGGQILLSRSAAGRAERWRSGYIGGALVRALAVCGEARPGRVALLQSTATVLDASGLPGIRIRKVAERPLRWLDDPVALYEASADHA